MERNKVNRDVLNELKKSSVKKFPDQQNLSKNYNNPMGKTTETVPPDRVEQKNFVMKFLFWNCKQLALKQKYDQFQLQVS